ncbi:hypothetical protein HELRODRAFT_81743 [Helobdella robusta]|uniref:CTCK domain-containing protein n=1 Tax=Helobdella robusta TaxID=6412 RepID=T1G4I3_HELRO|nr:hypothetical protein HELRODRAFT_81743 [Helobdella robusta]ESO01358.1 hypothetical protein HELRODRAFT_81743 [Helobdella robusta]
MIKPFDVLWDGNFYRHFDKQHRYHQQQHCHQHHHRRRCLHHFQDCIYPCQCSPELPTCQTGVQLIQDGCGCCQICARQQGDLCSKADGCDKSKGLYCNYTQDNGIRGICRAKAGRSCNVNGKIITDGQQYNPSCSLTCFCQDGRYACSTMCPQELHPPSNDHCRDAQLVSIKDRCCKEWVCPHPHNLVNLDDALPGHYSNGKSCKHEETEWSACSTTCGYGESVRMSNNNELCQATQERRMCNVRPCEMMVSEYNKNNPTSNATNDSKCKSTLESPISEKLRHANCESVDEYRLKFCGRCRKCCGPEKSRTVDIKYICPDGSTKTEPFMMIEKCVCHNKPNCSF